MVEHVGQGCGLSFLIVAVFAVMLHEREATPRAPTPKSEAPVAVVMDPPSPATSPATRSPLVVTTPATTDASTPPASKRVEPPVRTAPLPKPPTKVTTATLPTPKPTAAQPIPPPSRPHYRNPDSDFTQVGVGETMESIATRVYGSSEAVETLWRSNRDQVVAKGRPLEPGTWLRTPPCPDLQARLGRR